MLADFGPKGGGVIRVVDMGKLMKDDIVAERFGNVHQADIERNNDRAVRMMRTGTPASIGVREADFVIMIAVKFGKIIKAIGEIFLGLFHEDFLFSISSSLRGGVFYR